MMIKLLSFQLFSNFDFFYLLAYIQPVCLPSPGTNVEQLMGFHKAITSGWGETERGFQSNELLKVSIPYFNKNRCNSIYKNLLGNNQVKHIFLAFVAYLNQI